jgi:hypothetical protein
VVVNCNFNINKTFGFEQKELIGSNITKLMPRIFNEELHNKLILDFIKKEQSHLKLSSKVVFAMSKSSLLIEIKLTVKVIVTCHNSLIIAGLLENVPTEIGKGTIIFSVSTCEVFGVDSHFLKLLNNKFEPKQVIEE